MHRAHLDPSPALGGRRRLDGLAAAANSAAAHPASLPLLLAFAVALVSTINHFEGVDWGDDFALYMRQAKALVIGNVAEVVSDNRFAVDNSGWHTFSPYAYPWGWPLLAAPLVALFGMDFEAIKFLQVAALSVFTACWFSLLRPRVGTPAALLLTLVVAIAPSYVGWTETLLSDLPYLACVAATFLWIDRCRRRGLLLANETAPLVVLGLLIAFAFNIRREGFVLLIALAVLHGTLVARRSPDTSGMPWRRTLTPYTTFLVAALAFHLLLPTALLPHHGGTGLANVPIAFDYFRDIFAEQIGLKDPGDTPITLLGSSALGSGAMALVAALAVGGAVLRAVRRPEEDGFLAAYLCITASMILVAPYREGRYLFSITPLVLYFAYQALPELAVSWKGSTRAGAVAVSVAILFVPFVANARDTISNTLYHLDYEVSLDGPQTPPAQQMFATVVERTRPDDVILFFRARAMTLYTDRRAIQGANIEQLLPKVDWYAMQKGSTYSQRLLTDEEAAQFGLRKEWENDGWVLWEVGDL